MLGNLRNHRLQAPKLTHLSLQWSESCSRIPKFYFLIIGRVRLIGQFNPFFALAEGCSTGLPSDLPSDGLFHKTWLLKNYEASNHPHFSNNFTYIISFESHKILWAKQSWNYDLHITDQLRLREFERSSTGEWLSWFHMVFWLLVECLHDVFCSHSCIDHITLPFKYPFFPYSLPHWKRQYHQQQKYFSPYHPLSPAKNPSKAPAQLFPRAMFFQSSYAFCEPGDKSYQYFSCINWEKWAPEEINQNAGYRGCSLVQTAIYWTSENMSPCPAIVSMFKSLNHSEQRESHLSTVLCLLRRSDKIFSEEIRKVP